MRQHILTTALAAAVSALAFGQNLNPTVEVTNAYEGGASSIVKPAQQMAVPDSVMTFNLDFDYSVFEKPYQGAYEFKPYYVQLRPSPNPSTENRFYLRAGAGYTLHPELDLIWTPVRKERFRLGLYANHHSYFGRYHEFEAVNEEFTNWAFQTTGEKHSGFLSDTRAGVDGSYGWNSGVASLDVSYFHRMADNHVLFRKMGGIQASGRVRSLPSDEPHFLYDAAVKYHFLGDDSSFGGDVMPNVSSSIAESRFLFDGTFGSVLDGGSRMLADVDLDIVRYDGDRAGYTGGLSLTPKYVFSLDNWDFSLGARLSAIIYSDDWTLDKPKSGYIFPAAYVDFHLLDDRLILQASATGGDKIVSHSQRFMERPFSEMGTFGHGLERVRAMLGARGSIAGRFRYDLQGGYARWSRVPMDAYVALNPASFTSISTALPNVYLPALQETAFNLVFAELEYGWKSDHLTVDGNLAYRWTDVSALHVFAPAAFTGTVRPAWHWGDRFSAGLDVAWSTGRVSSFDDIVYSLPGWVDLGLSAEFRFTRHLGFWAKGGNLLNQVVQRTPLVAEAGMYATAGILLTF